MRLGVREQPVERQRQARRVGLVDGLAPGDRERPRERGLLVEQLLGAVTQPAGFDDRDERRRRQQVGQQVLVGGEPRQPRLHAVERVALREPFPLLAAPRLGLQELAGAGPDLVGRQQLAHREDPRLGDLARRTLVGDREVREPVDLVAPQVDAHRMVGGGGIHVDDRAPHRDLAARLDLVLAPVPDRDEPRDELVAVDLRALAHDDGLDVLDVRAEPLHERPHRSDDRPGQVLAAGPQPPDDAQPPAHRLGRGRHPFERQRLPRREELDRVVAEELAQVGGDPLGLDAGRHRDHDRSPGRGAGERGGEQRAGRLRNRDRARETPGRRDDDRVVGEQGGESGECRLHGRAFDPGTRTRPGGTPRVDPKTPPTVPGNCRAGRPPTTVGVAGLSRVGVGRAGVVAVHGGVDAVGDDALDRVGRLFDGDVHRLALALGDARQHVVGAALLRRRLADTDPHAHELVGVQVLFDRAQAVVAGEAAADLHPQHGRREVELVVHDHDLIGLDAEPAQQARRPLHPSRSCT